MKYNTLLKIIYHIHYVYTTNDAVYTISNPTMSYKIINQPRGGNFAAVITTFDYS